MKTSKALDALLSLLSLSSWSHLVTRLTLFTLLGSSCFAEPPQGSAKRSAEPQAQVESNSAGRRATLQTLQDGLRRQLTSALHLSDSARAPRLTDRDARVYTSQKLNVSERYCERERAERAHFDQPNISPHVHRYHLETAQRYARACKVNVYAHQRQVIGFSFTNDLDNFINPQRRSPYHSERVFTMRFEERVKQNIHLRVFDRVGLTQRVERDFMESVFVFLPRLVLPYLRYGCDSCTPRQVAMILPTGEEVVFDQLTRELRGGALEEEAIDLNTSPKKRRFAKITYHGRGMMIRADRLGGLPERAYPRASNQHEDPQNALITYRGRSCRVPKVKIWKHAHSKRIRPSFRYATDRAFLEEVIKPHCGWNLRVRDLR